KQVNDSHGHLVGSKFLQALGRTFRNAVRTHDRVFRYGGDEFVILLNGLSASKGFDIAERIRKNIEKRVFFIDQVRLTTTLSIGVASYPDHTREAEVLLKLADEAMYSA